MMGVRMVLEFIFTPAELKILDDPLPFKRSETKQDKDEDAEIQDISTEVRHQIHYFTRYMVSELESQQCQHGPKFSNNGQKTQILRR